MSEMSERTEKLFASIEAHRKRREAEYQWLMRISGMSIEELDADLCAPDPGAEEED